MAQIVYLVRGLRRIKEAQAEIVVCKKHTWAQIGSKRFLLGATAFFTRKSAERSKLGVLHKTLEHKALAYIKPYIWNNAREQLATYKEMRVIH
jgi:hypothetical protein